MQTELNKQQISALNTMASDWLQTAKGASLLWASTAKLIGNSANEVLKGTADLTKFKKVLSDMYENSKTMAISAYYESAVKEVENIIEMAKTMKQGKDYSFSQIEEFATNENYDLTELGSSTVGRSFICLEHTERDIVISFILTGYFSATGNQYTCIYSDIN